MRKLCTLVCLLLLLACAVARAEEEAPDAELAALLAAAHPDCAVAAFDAWGDTASAVMSANGRNILCVAEKRDGAWTLAVDNPAALRPGDEVPSLFLDCDTALFWTYRQGDVSTTYSVSRYSDCWGPVSSMRREAQGDGESSETEVLWDSVHGGTLWCRRYLCDENDNILYTTNTTPLPAAWMANRIELATFDASVLPAFDETEYEYAWQDLLEKAAAELLPGDTFLGGTLNWGDGGIELWMQKPDGSRVLVGCTYNGETPDGWVLTTSAPLPADTVYGYENCSDSLCIGERLLVNIAPQADGSWGVDFVESLGEWGFYYLGSDWIATEWLHPQRIVFGAHPWSDISAIDWLSLPATADEAIAAMDCTGWAVVNNPNPEDRLHLRAEPDKNAASLGKYYNGAPARVLARKGDWTQVSVFGVEGWMMTRYLAFDEAGKNVANAFPTMTMPDDETALFEDKPLGAVIASLRKGQEVQVLGLIGEAWRHVRVCETGLTGYVNQTETRPVNE